MKVVSFRKAGLCAVAVCLFWPGLANTAPIPLPQVTLGQAPQVAIFYDGPQSALSEGPLDARQIQNLLGHFNLTGEIIPIGEYRPGQLAKYRAAFFVGTATGTK